MERYWISGSYYLIRLQRLSSSEHYSKRPGDLFNQQIFDLPYWNHCNSCL
ncbi:unnamed protein product [Strongylus vulgaris]|uniref:Uncharacterized protein n=1 Tax=Strongylus vulgaris TaxID=40348 RepID=A0A3P7IWQ6_STRVU|nr:unnamed protein product [Strongylus vulgaris]